MLRRAHELARRVVSAYEAYELSTVFHRVLNFCTVDLSSLYLDVLKDRLYCDHPDDPGRRTAQTALWHMAGSLLTLLAPVLSFTTDEAWEHLPGSREPSVHLALFDRIGGVAADPGLDARWERLLALRETAYGQLEELRQAERIGKSLEARAVIVGDPGALQEDLEACGADLAELLIVSSVAFEAGGGGQDLDPYPGLLVRCEPWEAPTCERCWKRTDALVDDPELPGLCPRCHRVVERLVAEGRVSPGDGDAGRP